MALDKDTLESSHRYLSKAAILILPGMVILQVVFHKGLLSENIHDIPELIVLIIWSFLLSTPYYFAAEVMMLWLSTPLEHLGKGDLIQQSSDYYEESVPFALLLTLITVVAYKLMLWLNRPAFESFAGIRRQHVICIVSIGFTMLLSAPLAIVYYGLLDKIVIMIAKTKTKTKH